MLESLLKRVPSVAARIAERDDLLKACGFVPPGHFYSPIVSLAEVQRDRHRIFRTPERSIPGVEMNEAAQLALLDDFAKLYPSIDFPTLKTAGRRYFFENPAYSYSDAIMLNCMMRHFQPRRIVEVGSGYSSCAMLDTNAFHMANPAEVLFIDPYPELLRSLLLPADHEAVHVIPKPLQDVPMDVFTALESGDFLFIDSTHVSKTGSDVNHLFFDIVPSLKRGVFLHIHDVFYPFEYPEGWVLEGRSWNELYVLRAFLQFNTAFAITMMNTFVELFHEDWFREHMPRCLENRGGSIWFRKGGA